MKEGIWQKGTKLKKNVEQKERGIKRSMEERIDLEEREQWQCMWVC